MRWWSRPRTGAERYFAERLRDPVFAEAYEKAYAAERALIEEEEAAARRREEGPTPMYPHCDPLVLHEPRSDHVVGGLVSDDGASWKLSIHQIVEAPWLSVHDGTAPVAPVPLDTPRFVMPLTRPAWTALQSSTLLDDKRELRLRFVAAAERNGQPSNVDAPPVTSAGGRATRSHQNDVLSSLPFSANGWPLFAALFARNANGHARTAVPLFRGSSWSLITATDVEDLAMQPSPRWSARAGSNASVPNWRSVIWSVQTAIAFGLTSEQWRRESARLDHGECVYCDSHPELQQERVDQGIPFTGHDPDPATAVRSIERIEAWSGNVREVPIQEDPL